MPVMARRLQASEDSCTKGPVAGAHSQQHLSNERIQRLLTPHNRQGDVTQKSFKASSSGCFHDSSRAEPHIKATAEGWSTCLCEEAGAQSPSGGCTGKCSPAPFQVSFVHLLPADFIVIPAQRQAQERHCLKDARGYGLLPFPLQFLRLPTNPYQESPCPKPLTISAGSSEHGAKHSRAKTEAGPRPSQVLWTLLTRVRGGHGPFCSQGSSALRLAPSPPQLHPVQLALELQQGARVPSPMPRWSRISAVKNSPGSTLQRLPGRFAPCSRRRQGQVLAGSVQARSGHIRAGPPERRRLVRLEEASRGSRPRVQHHAVHQAPRCPSPGPATLLPGAHGSAGEAPFIPGRARSRYSAGHLSVHPQSRLTGAAAWRPFQCHPINMLPLHGLALLSSRCTTRPHPQTVTAAPRPSSAPQRSSCSCFASASPSSCLKFLLLPRLGPEVPQQSTE